MKSKVFKKIIAVVCATALMLSAASAVMFATVSAEAESVSKVVVDFEDQNGVGKQIGDVASKLVDTSTITNAVFDAWKVNAGNYCASVNGKGNWAAINLPENWWVYTNESDGITYTKPNIISFDIMSSTTSKSASLNSVAFTTGASSESPNPNKLTKLTAVGQVTASAKTYRTVTYKIPTTLDLSQFTKVVVNCWGTNDNCYIDNVTLVYPKSFTATFSGTETAELASPVADISQKFTEGETSITLPEATLANGKTFAGWVTDADSATVLPAGTPVALEDDTAFYAVAADRGPFPTPAAPEVTAKTFNSVTLAALGAGFVYSKDGVTWQESNVFTSLEPETRYTFYTKHIATTAYDESAASAGTTVTTDVITEFIFNSTYVTLSDNTANVGFASNDGYPNISKTGLTAGKGVTLTTKYSVAPGVYDLTLFARSYAGRAPIDIEVNGTTVAESLDTSKDASGKTGNNLAHALSSITIPETTVLTIKVTTTSSGSLYLNSLKLTKTAEYNNLSIVMDTGAAMRIDKKTDGIRFSATVDKTALDAYTKDSATVTEVGMLIAKSGIADSDMILENAEESLTLNAVVDTDVVVAKYGDATMKTNESANAYEIVGSLVEIKLSNANQKYVAKAYIKFTVGSETKVVYSNMSDARSIAQVASLIQQEGLADPDDDTIYYNTLCGTHKTVVDDWAAVYSES